MRATNGSSFKALIAFVTLLAASLATPVSALGISRGGAGFLQPLRCTTSACWAFSGECKVGNDCLTGNCYEGKCAIGEKCSVEG